MNRFKVFNDPIHGFISIESALIFKLIEHPWFQRLRRIKQLGLTDYVYPGAIHTRFHHAIGAYHIMRQALWTLRRKGHEISKQEEEAALIAILLHDMGHGPFSHTLEKCLIPEVNHERITILFMEHLNAQFNGELDLALDIFHDRYPRRFFHDLVSSQLDMDRLDYLSRDSFFTGVNEGNVNHARIIDMIDVLDDHIVVEAKGIHSIEKFLQSRRFMYWQVYLHKTVVCAESMLVKIMERALELHEETGKLTASPVLQFFLDNRVDVDRFLRDDKVLDTFAKLDDYDIFSAVKEWMNHEDAVLSYLCRCLIDRKLFKIEVFDEAVGFDLDLKRQEVAEALHTHKDAVKHAVYTFAMSHSLYDKNQTRIKILYKNGKVREISEASEQWDEKSWLKNTTKYYLCTPKLG